MYNKEHVSKKALGTPAITVTMQCKVTPETKSLFSASYKREKKKNKASLWSFFILLSTLLPTYFKALSKHVAPYTFLVTKF